MFIGSFTDYCVLCSDLARTTPEEDYSYINCKKCGNIIISKEKFTLTEKQIIRKNIKLVRDKTNNYKDFIVICQDPLKGKSYLQYKIIAWVGNDFIVYPNE